MPNPRLANRYAKSLLDLSNEKGELENVLKDMHYFQSVVKESRDFENLLMSPIVKSDKKHTIFQQIFADRFSGLTNAFMKLVLDKGRESNLPEIAEAFQHQYNDYKNIKQVVVTTATKMTPEISRKVSERIAGYLPNTTVEIIEKIDESLIGGFIIKIDDKLYDASVKKELNEIKQKFTTNDYAPSI